MKHKNKYSNYRKFIDKNLRSDFKISPQRFKN